MQYKFSKYKVSKSIFFHIDIQEDILYPITLLRFSSWTSEIIQEIINGISTSKISNKDYKYQTEGDDLYIYSNGYGVQFFNLHSPSKEADLVLPHDEFIKFLKDFKKFVEENS